MVTPTRPPAHATGDRIFGRQRDLDALRARLDDARNGRGRLIVCVGEPGVGKTRLTKELAGIALAAGTGVAWGRCVEARYDEAAAAGRRRFDRMRAVEPRPATGEYLVLQCALAEHLGVSEDATRSCTTRLPDSR